MSRPDLSILICSLHARGEHREHLLTRLRGQNAACLVRCEIIINIDGGEATIGEKRNRLLDASVGQYVVFIDDDDDISDDYLEQIFIGIDMGVDHIGVGMLYAPVDSPIPPILVECSMHHGWTFDGTKYLRPPQHVCAIRHELARQVRFPEISFREDKEYAEAMRHLVKSEMVITKPIYIYRFVEHK